MVWDRDKWGLGRGVERGAHTWDSPSQAEPTGTWLSLQELVLGDTASQGSTDGHTSCFLLPLSTSFAALQTPRGQGLRGHTMWPSKNILPCPHSSHGKWKMGFSGFCFVVWLHEVAVSIQSEAPKHIFNSNGKVFQRDKHRGLEAIWQAGSSLSFPFLLKHEPRFLRTKAKTAPGPDLLLTTSRWATRSWKVTPSLSYAPQYPLYLAHVFLISPAETNCQSSLQTSPASGNVSCPPHSPSGFTLPNRDGLSTPNVLNISLLQNLFCCCGCCLAAKRQEAI